MISVPGWIEADPLSDQQHAECLLSLFRGLRVYKINEKMTLSGILELEFGGIDCEFGGLSQGRIQPERLNGAISAIFGSQVN